MTLALIFSFLAQTVQADYCTASGGCDEYIYQVQVGTINNNVTGCGNYTDYTSSYSTVMEAGTGYSITVVTAVDGTPYAGYEGDKCGIWVDWNQDGDFYDINETVYSADGYGLFTTTITPPTEALPGDTRMRVRLMYTGYGETLSPCGTTQFGEVEDYTINVAGGTLKISGYVLTAEAEPIEGVLITGTNGIGSTMTDVNGHYELTAPTNPWSGQITPSKTYWNFVPSTYVLANVIVDIAFVDFEGTYNYNYGGGQGTVGDPYLIYTPEHMNEIGVRLGHWDSYFKLMADIDLSGYTGTSFNIIGNVNDGPFTGWFDGNGHTISNFTYSSTATDRIGLFGDIDGMLTYIENLTLIDPNVNAGTGERVGALVGRLDNSSKIVSCHVIGGSVSGALGVGGLAGSQRESGIEHCSSSSSVSGDWDIGGLVGMVWRASISHSYSTGLVQGTNWYMGGLVGSVSEGGIYDCYATGSVSGGDNVGGLVGELYAYSQPALIRNCYAAGLVSSSGYTGGLIAFNYVDAGTVLDSFWDVNSSGQTTSGGGTGKTTTEMQTQSTFTDAGWDFTIPFWKMCECGGYPRLAWEVIKYGGGGGTAESPYLLCTAEQMNEIGVDSNDWDKHFKLMADIDLSGYTGTQFNIIGNYSNPFTGVFDGNGHTISNFTYRATNESYIGLFGYIDSHSAEIKNLGLIDPNIVGETFLANQRVGSLAARINQGIIANCYVENCYVSNLYQVAGGLVGSLIDGEITNCHTNGSVYGESDTGGLVGHCSSGGTITDCYSNADTTGEDEIGGLVGINLGTISRCSSGSTVSGSENIGGLVGKNLEGIILQSYSTASVSGDIYIGGLVGLNNTYVGRTAHISNCYSTGSVVGYNYAAGLVGNNLCSAISYCYSNGYVEATVVAGGLVASNGGCLASTCVSSFWDKDTSQTFWSRQGTGKTTEEMMQEATFTNWDFTTPLWKICEGTNYPKLAWQVPLPADFVCPDGVETNDLAVLVEQWLLEKLSADISPDEGDGFVDFSDWAVFANAWQSTSEPQSANWNPKCDIAPEGGDGIVDMNDLTVFVNHWLQFSAYCADIAPEPDGDGTVNMLDFAILANNWLAGVE